MTSTRYTLTALAAGALMLGAGGVASAQTPYNSYQSTPRVPSSCRNVETLSGGYVSAECETTGGFRWSTIRAFDCRGDLSNRDGVLACSGATATVGPLYPHGSSGTTASSGQSGAGDVIGALLGAVFGVNSGQGFEDDWERGRRPLAERRADLEARIDAGVRDGSISYAEANRLRGDYDGLVQLEARYAADGRLSAQERADLQDRYQRLSQRVEDRRDDDGYDQWRPLADERYAFDARVEAAVRSRRISSAEGRRLHVPLVTGVETPAGDDDASLPVPEVLPPISLADGEGTLRSLSEWAGRPLMVNYWATWCGPCRREIPLLNELRAEGMPPQLEIIGIAVDFRDDVPAYAEETPIDYPVLIGEEDGLAAVQAMGMQPAFPFTVFADSQHRILTVKVGELHRDEAELILGSLAEVDAGSLTLADARARIDAGLKDLAARRATQETTAAAARAPAAAPAG